MKQKYYTMAEAAIELGMKKSALYALVERRLRGEKPICEMVGKTRFFLPLQVATLKAERESWGNSGPQMGRPPKINK
ncbi:MAG: hypothetical protein GY841_18585 [FCB group bacterium]|nr:hypothetical protein [FCB group bacterium]